MKFWAATAVGAKNATDIQTCLCLGGSLIVVSKLLQLKLIIFI